ncbi:hypothetical protein Fmac_001708 [Flemingia macrophylla]|uniref:Phospholipid/glycerol acyltransferase domain-containing protein n=1 Tax=Flemingia macrophylla TaxID=520843 RepID=A0ABD1NIN5_9FABA
MMTKLKGRLRVEARTDPIRKIGKAVVSELKEFTSWFWPPSSGIEPEFPSISVTAIEMMCSFFVASWTGVVKYHGPRPSRRPKQVFVANHTSMIDFIILEQMTAFAVIMQKHPGLASSSSIASFMLRDHVQRDDNNPLLIFPKGTCVNNHYTVMFKKGAFELGCTVCPVAIKQSFTMHLLQLMTSWAVVCDVWYLEPRDLNPGETPIEFAERVRNITSVRAGLKKVPWDEYLNFPFRSSPLRLRFHCSSIELKLCH